MLGQSKEIVASELSVEPSSHLAGPADANAGGKARAGAGPWYLSIRFKLVALVSLTIFLSLSTMIYLAGGFFRNRSETLIQEYNLSLARLIGQKVEADLRDLVFTARMLGSLLEEAAPARRNHHSTRFFQARGSTLLIGLADARPGQLSFRYQLLNEAALAAGEIRKKDLIDRVGSFSAKLSSAHGGAFVVENLAAGFKIPALALSFPAEDGTGRVFVLVVESAPLLRAFETTGQAEIFQLSLVNREGTVLAATDRAEALAAANRRGVPIIQTLLRGKIDNGSQKFSYGGVDFLGSYHVLSFGGMGVVSTVRADRAFEAVASIQKRNIQLTVIVLTAAFLLVFFFSRTLTIPIVRLVRATREVEAGRFDVAIQPASRDEVGMLTSSFLAMARGLAERERIKSTFGKFVNPKIVERALESDLQLGGEERICTILFTDIRDFTGLSEQAQPEAVVQLLNSYFTVMVECVHSKGGVVDKFIGDAIMAHWGAIESTVNDAANAIDAALLMRRALSALNEQNALLGRPSVRFGCGINTGTVIAGQIGSKTRLEYTVIGDAVNLASRIEYLNKLFGTDILISQYSYEQVSGLYRLARTQPVEIKGKAKPETVYAVLGRLDDPDAPRTVRELRARLGIKWTPAAAQESLALSSDRIAGEELEAGHDLVQ